jgi:hypothetical protein
MSHLDKTANTEATPVDVDELLTNIRNQFYTEATAKKFFTDRNVLLLAVTYPAHWLKERGITWSADRYFQTLRDLLQEIKRHGATGSIKYFPGYLLKCVQDHFAHNSDTYCEEGKRMRSTWERALGRAISAAQSEQMRADEQTVAVLAQAHRVLAINRHRPKTPKSNDLQGSLF